MPLFFGDLLAATATWDGEERALYTLLLAYQWVGGALSAEPKRLAKMCQYDAANFNALWRTVGPKFERSESGLLNARLEEHRSKAQQISAARSVVGRRGGQASAQAKAQANPQANDPNLLKQISTILSYPILSNLGEELDQEKSQDREVKPERLDLGFSNGQDEPPEPGSSLAISGIFESWKYIFGHKAAQLDAKRAKLIGKALKLYTPDQLIGCFQGYARSPHHMGQNDRATIYDAIGLLLRDAEHIDAGLAFLKNAPRTLSKIEAARAMMQSKIEQGESHERSHTQPPSLDAPLGLIR